jgi:hypothetical protein
MGGSRARAGGQVWGYDMRRRHRIATGIAERQLEELDGVPRRELTELLGRPVQVLVMGPDDCPYLITTLVLRHFGGTLRVHVGVDTGGWDTTAAVVRTALLPPRPARTGGFDLADPMPGRHRWPRGVTNPDS